LKFGLNHITKLIEKRKAKLVVIAHDIDPVELVVWLPALCRKQNVPYCIVKGKARLGQLVHMKTATAVALTDVRKEDSSKLDQIVNAVKPMFNLNVEALKKWGGGILGAKAQAVVKKQKKLAAREAAKTVTKKA
jgi:large subunit ribosomal protein L7Ae